MAGGPKRRIRRFEDRFRKERAGAPSRHVYDDADFRSRVRNGYNAGLKLYRMSGREKELWESLSEWDPNMLANDTQNLRRQDTDVIERYEKVNGPGRAETASHAARAKMRLRSVARVETGDNLPGRG